MHIELSSKSADKWDTSDACLLLQGGFSNEISAPTLTIEPLWSSQVITNAHIACIRPQLAGKPRNLANIFFIAENTACVALKDLVQSVARDL